MFLWAVDLLLTDQLHPKNSPRQLWLSLRDFMASSASWTEEAVLDDDGRLVLEIEAIRWA
jgi:hypothetical protein